MLVLLPLKVVPLSPPREWASLMEPLARTSGPMDAQPAKAAAANAWGSRENHSCAMGSTARQAGTSRGRGSRVGHVSASTRSRGAATARVRGEGAAAAT